MARFVKARGWTLDVDQEWIDTTAGVPTIDRQWRAADSNGHEHYYDGERYEYPTLDYIIDAEHWCDGTEGIALHDPHMAVDESHYECKICRDTVTPGLHPPGHPTAIPGVTRATLTAVNSDGVTVTISATEDEVGQIDERVTEAGRASAARRIVSDAPSNRVLRMELAP